MTREEISALEAHVAVYARENLVSAMITLMPRQRAFAPVHSIASSANIHCPPKVV